MSYLVAMLLLYMDSFEAFVALANMLNANHFYSFFRMNADEIAKHVDVIKILMKSCLPSIYDHLVLKHDINCQLFILDWFLTLFSKSLPLDIAARVWDIYLCDGEIELYRVTLGLLQYFSKTLLEGGFEECMRFLSHLSRMHDVCLFHFILFFLVSAVVARCTCFDSLSIVSTYGPTSYRYTTANR